MNTNKEFLVQLELNGYKRIKLAKEQKNDESYLKMIKAIEEYKKEVVNNG